MKRPGMAFDASLRVRDSSDTIPATLPISFMSDMNNIIPTRNGANAISTRVELPQVLSIRRYNLILPGQIMAVSLQ
jgi:hypothetical protein